MPLGLSSRSGARPLDHGPRALLRLRWSDHDLTALGGGRRVRVDERERSDHRRAAGAAGAHTAGAATGRARSRRAKSG